MPKVIAIHEIIRRVNGVQEVIAPKSRFDASEEEIASLGSAVSLLAERVDLVEPEAEAPAAEKTLKDLTVAELKALAAERQVDVSGLSKKAELVSALEAAEAAADAADAAADEEDLV